MPSENNCIIEDVDNEVNFLNPYDFNDSDSFDSSDDDDGNCVDTCENNSFNSNDNDGLESFTFDDNSLLNEHVGELHDMLCNVDDALNVDASLLDLNDVEFDTFHDNCIDDAIYIHDLLGEEKEEMDGSERDALLNSEKEREDEKQETMVEGVENENDVLESFTFGDESLSNELANDLHEMLCGDDDMNIEASLCDLSDIECVTFHDNCLDDALYIHDLIGKDRSEGVENENVKEEVEDKKKTRNESVREQVDEKVRNDEKEFEAAHTSSLGVKGTVGYAAPDYAKMSLPDRVMEIIADATMLYRKEDTSSKSCSQIKLLKYSFQCLGLVLLVQWIHQEKGWMLAQ
nr:hypothetical protein Iba_chr10aCG14440 [Ipomoea batatas]